MYTHFTPAFSTFDSLSPPMPDLINTPYLIQSEFDSLHDTLSLLHPDSIHNGYYSSGSGCSSHTFPSWLTSHENQTQRPSLIQKSSMSSHSLLHNNWTHLLLPSIASHFFDSQSGPVRRVYSAGDLQRVNMERQSHRSSESSLSNESNAIIEGMSKAYPYSPEEKRERIERYRSKRNLRSFNKKIKYACRKTLADNRPRVRGRFVRNEEIEKSSQFQWGHISGHQDVEDEDDNYWVNFLDAFSSNILP